MDDFRQMISLDELTSDGTITLARTAAEAIRGLNWTTNCDAGLDQPAVAYDVLGALSQAAAGSGSCSPRSPATSTRPWPPGNSATTAARTLPWPSRAP